MAFGDVLARPRWRRECAGHLVDRRVRWMSGLLRASHSSRFAALAWWDDPTALPARIVKPL